MKKGMLTAIVLMGIFCMAAGCGNAGTGSSRTTAKQTSSNGQTKVTVISREEGSGTRDTFVQITGILKTDKEGRKIDRTTDKAVIVKDSKEMIQKVVKDPSAIGYVSLGEYLKTSDSGIKALKIDGKEASKENVKKDSYQLSRPFQLAYSGKLNELEEEFLRYVMSEGQGIVKKSYVPVGKKTSFLSLKPEGNLIIAGSTSVAPLMQELSDAYMEKNPNAKIEIKVTDSTSGLTAAMQGACDFAMASRNLKDYEQELLHSKTIAKDGIAVIVNEQNDQNDISMKRLQQIFTAQITTYEK